MSKTKKSKSTSEKLALVRNSGSRSITTMFGRNADMDGMIVHSRAPMIKPSKWPVDEDGNNLQLAGIITALKTVVRVDGKTKTPWCLIELSPDGRSVGVAIPATGTILQALKIEASEAKEAEDVEYSCPFIGHKGVFELLPDKIPSKKGNDAWNFVVAVSEKPAIVG